MQIYWGSDNRGKGECDSDINCLASDNHRKYTTVTNQCQRFPWRLMWHLLFAIVGLVSRISLVGYCMSRANCYYERKGPVCYVLTFYNQYSYGAIYQCCSYLFYREIHLLRFICCNCTLIYDKYVNLLCLICNHQINLILLKILNTFFCDICNHNMLLQTNKSTIY